MIDSLLLSIWGFRMKKIMIIFILLPAIYVAALFALLFLSRNDYYDGINKSIETAFSSTTGATIPETQFMSHRLIQADMRDNLITQQDADNAFSNTTGYFNEVKNKCITENNQLTGSILACANRVLGNHFYYYPSREVAPAWAGHNSDCDANVYLLLDALHLANKTASIVYAPGHAFITWTDEATGEPMWWETTSSHNHGESADLARNDLYRKTMAPFYYHPKSASFAQNFYSSVITLRSLSPELQEKRLKQAATLFPDNPFVTDIRYFLKKSLSSTDARRLQALLKTDISSVTKKYLLADYYLKNGNKSQSAYYANKINIENCNPKCQILKKKLSLQDKALLAISDKLKKIPSIINMGSLM